MRVHAKSRVNVERSATPMNMPRHPNPIQAAAASNIGPATTPNEPAKVQRAMLFSRRCGSASMSEACERLTNAPEDGLKRMKDASKRAKEVLMPVRKSEMVKN